MNNDNKKVLKNLLLYLGVPVLIFFVIFMVMSRNPQTENYKYYEILNFFENDQVEGYTLNLGSGEMEIAIKADVTDEPTVSEESEASGTESETSSDAGSEGTASNTTTGTPKTIYYELPNVTLFYEDVRDDIERYNAANPDNKMKQDLIRPAETNWLVSMLPMLISLGLLIVLTVVMMRRMGSMGGGDRQMNFGKAKIKQISDESRKTTFADVAGADEEKEELREIVEFLKQPSKFNSLGARIPKGVLLIGPPGTGKTLLARAVAGEAGVPFFSISGSDFVEMFVGVGASRVRDLFDKAKKNHPCIIFIDEIDAVGRQRGAGLGGGNDEREQTLNQLLVEMDGFGANEGVIMIAATNRPDILDPALMRPGRFDRQITVNYPDVIGREAILRVHARGKPIAPDVKLDTIAKTTAGFTGADLENLLNEAALLAARRNRKAITMQEIQEASIKVVVGPEKKSRVMSDKEKRLTAYHEAGHAIASYYCDSKDPVHQISIIPAGLAGGYTMYLPTEDRSYRSRNEMREELITLLGGRVAEELVLGDISTGASNDIERATKTARDMVTKYGMSEKLGTITYGSDQSNPFLGKEMGRVSDYSERTASEIDDEIRDMITTAHEKTVEILSGHMDKLHELAAILLEKEKIGGEDFAAIMKGNYIAGTKEGTKKIEDSTDETLSAEADGTEVDSKSEVSKENSEEDKTENSDSEKTKD